MKPSRSQIEDALLIVLLVFAPLALASVHTWAYSGIALLSLIIFDLHFLRQTDAFRRVISVPVSLGILFFLWINLLYICPLPTDLIKLISPETYNIKEAYMTGPRSWETLSIYSHATMIYLVKFTSYAMVFLFILSKITGSSHCHEGRDETDVRGRGRSPKTDIRYTYIFLGALCSLLVILLHSLCDFNMHIPANALYFLVILAIVTGIAMAMSGRGDLNVVFMNKLVTSIIIIGFGIAVFGIAQKLSWNGKIYWLIKKEGGNFGPYINLDHYAGYMGMCVLLAISKFVSKIAGSSLPHIRRLKDKIIWFSSPEANKTCIYLFFAIVMTAALFLTTSRGGIMSFAAALFVFYFVCVISASRRKRNRLLLAAVLAVLLMCIMILWIGPEETVDKFKMLNKVVRFFIKEKAILSEIRPRMWKGTIDLIKDFRLFGTGLGAYSEIFAKYRTFPARYGFLRYAHNDYLQLVSEMGISGGIFIFGLLVWYIRRFSECFRLLKDNE